jgi:methionyl-tRNA synthetase
MLENKAKYITTTLPYVNSNPHIGFASEVVAADALARYWRLMGYEVFFNTGTDEHGQKVAQKADNEGRDPQEYVDQYAGEFERLKESLNLSYDRFIRTTDEVHKTAAQEMWRRCAANLNETGESDIYKKTYTGLYCVGCELFYKENELDDNKCCKIHGQPVEEVEEENYFFRLSRYAPQLIDYLNDESKTSPDWQRQWALNFVQGGLEDLSISRHVSRMDWGVPVPDDDQHVMYVWFDALTNYISTLGWPNVEGDFKKFWVEGETFQVAGKDQVRFQSIIWQAMLMSAKLPTTDHIFYRGFINIDGQKMSKSLGNAISPNEMVERYGTDATRYILLRHTHPHEDSDFTWEKMDEWYTANLVNGLGNLVSRVMKMAETHLEEPIERPAFGNLDPAFLLALDQYNFQDACDIIWKKVGDLDQKITITEPFKLIKENKEQGKKLISELVYDVYLIGRLLFPIMPEANVKIKEAVLQNKKPVNLFVRLEV